MCVKSEGNCAVSYPTASCESVIKCCILNSVETVNYMFRDSWRLVHRDFWKLQSHIFIQVTAPLRLPSCAHICLDFLLCIACWFLLFPCSVSPTLRHFVQQTERSRNQEQGSYFWSDTGALKVLDKYTHYICGKGVWRGNQSQKRMLHCNKQLVTSN